MSYYDLRASCFLNRLYCYFKYVLFPLPASPHTKNMDFVSLARKLSISYPRSVGLIRFGKDEHIGTILEFTFKITSNYSNDIL